MPRLTMGNATYAPSSVTRSILTHEGWKELETYEDATVRDNGEGGILRAPQAMLRAYSNDVNFYGDEDYQRGNGIHVQTKTEAKQFARYYESKEVQQYVMDCDGDIALKRVMGTVISKHDFGHFAQEWIVVVGYDKHDDDWDGFGGMDALRYERWYVRLRS